MTKPYSKDRRTRGVAAAGAGGSCGEVAQQFSIGSSSVARGAQRFRRTGCVAAKPMGGERHSRLKDERDLRLARGAAVARCGGGRLSDFAGQSYQNVSRETFWYDWRGEYAHGLLHPAA